jgi:hypothetical protein
MHPTLDILADEIRRQSVAEPLPLQIRLMLEHLKRAEEERRAASDAVQQQQKKPPEG